MRNRRTVGGFSSSSWPLRCFHGSSESEEKLKITTVLLGLLPNSRDAKAERAGVAQGVNQKGTLTWALRWWSKVPGPVVTQLPKLLPGLLFSLHLFWRRGSEQDISS